jgi:hypothetical protein
LPNAGRLTLNTGLLYTKHSYDTYFQLSANGFFFAKPDVTNSPYNETPGMRTALFMNLEKYFNSDYTFLLHGGFSSRNKENSYVVGGSVSLPIKYEFDHDRRLYLGCFYRQKDAITPTVNILMDNYILLTTSQQQQLQRMLMLDLILETIWVLIIIATFY